MPDNVSSPLHHCDTVSPEDFEVLLPPDYTPSEDEEFMSPLQRAYFYKKLKQWRLEILEDAESTLEQLRQGRQDKEDEIDTAFIESDRSLELRARDRQRKLLNKIDRAIERLRIGRYGYCKMTGDPIELKRLDARPVAEYSLEGQEMHEHQERLNKK